MDRIWPKDIVVRPLVLPDIFSIVSTSILCGTFCYFLELSVNFLLQVIVLQRYTEGLNDEMHFT